MQTILREGGIPMHKVLALAGNPNVGKSTLFNALTGMRQHTGNWPGKTVSCARGTCRYGSDTYTLVDLPGCYSLLTHSPEEEISREFLCSGQADAVIAVCDAACLERSLNLVLQILELKVPVLLCVNLLDEAKKKQISVNLEVLSRELHIPVIGVCAHQKKSLQPLFPAIKELLEHFEIPDTKFSKSEQPDTAAEVFVKRCEEICRKAVTCTAASYSAPDRRLDALFTSKKTGLPILFLLLFALFWLTIRGANVPSALLSDVLFEALDFLAESARDLHIPEFLCEPLLSGIFRVLAWVVSAMLPPMAIFFPLFTLLEDFGYLPRIAFCLDRCFQKCHACGKQALTLCKALGCNAVGVTGCRIIDSPRERMIAILTNSLTPCNGRFPTILTITSLFFFAGSRGLSSSLGAALTLTLVFLFSVLMTLFTSWLLSKTLLKGMPSSFVLELPPYRKPQFGKVILRSILDRTVFVLGRAILTAAPAGLLIWLSANVSLGECTLLAHCVQFLDPLGRLLGMDGVILMAFLLGLPANEIVIPVMLMTYLAQGSLLEIQDLSVLRQLLAANGWTWVTAVCVILFSLMHWPCGTTCLTIQRETKSLKWTLLAILLPTLLGMTACFLFASCARIVFF